MQRSIHITFHNSDQLKDIERYLKRKKIKYHVTVHAFQLFIYCFIDYLNRVDSKKNNQPN